MASSSSGSDDSDSPESKLKRIKNSIFGSVYAMRQKSWKKLSTKETEQQQPPQELFEVVAEEPEPTLTTKIKEQTKKTSETVKTKLSKSKEVLKKTGQDQAEKLANVYTLTGKQRYIGFGVFSSVGAVLTFLAFWATPDIEDNPVPFAITSVIGTLFQLTSVGFLYGPVRYLKTLFKKTRVLATSMYLFWVFFTLFSAVVIKKKFIIILAIVFQYIAYGWYCLSYIPFGRRMVVGCFEQLV